ncbi:bacteriohemerythrin [Noviherbaspirillum malthae]|uniref:bacteriohemerythrin n=1 Tax=Noviherbaspirillum malthae TaxID=1260987 RepID=UPI00188FED7D|nr:hemerythrin family protein [Noviherbaspirillum malthae]
METTETPRSGGMAYRLGIAALDRSHRELMDAFVTLQALPDEQFLHRYPDLVAKIERDFRQEEAMMEKLDLPSFQTHMEQHARVLNALHHAASSLMQGDIELGRRAIMLLADWFPYHIDTMDRRLVMAIDTSAARRHLRTDNSESSD